MTVVAVAFLSLLSFVLTGAEVVRRICNVSPGSTIQKMGKHYYNTGQFNAALGCFLILSETVNEAPLFSNIAGAYLELDMHKEAEESIKKAVALGPRCYNCLRAASAVYHRQSRFVDALAYDSLLLKYHPDDVETHLQIVDDLQKANMYARSVYYVETVLDVLTPTRSEKVRALVQASLAKRFTGELVDALKYSREAVRSTVNVVVADTDDKHVKRYQELAFRMYCDVSLAYGLVENVHDVARAYVKKFSNVPEAACYAAVGARVSWESNLVLVKMQKDVLGQVVDNYARVVKSEKARDFKCSPSIFLPFEFSPDEIKNVTRIIAAMDWIKMKDKRGKVQKILKTLDLEYKKAKRLRIGFIGTWFYQHDASFSLHRLLSVWVNSSKYEIFIYMLSEHRDELTKWYEQTLGVNNFVYLHRLDTDQAVARIAGDRIHMLFDIMGHFYLARHEILAARPAPIQIAFFGYPSTTGSEAIDYFVCDPVACPNSSHFTEKLISLSIPPLVAPRTWKEVALPELWLKDSILKATINRKNFGIKDSDFVFCYVPEIHYLGVDPVTFRAWIEILTNSPQAHMVFFFVAKSAEATIDQEFKANGLRDRIHLYSKIVQYPGQMELDSVCDLCLEAFLYNSYIRAADLLNHGIPVLALLGKTTSSRMTASVIVGSGQGKSLVAKTREEYIFRAIEYWKKPQELLRVLQELKSSKREQNRPLFNSRVLHHVLEESMRMIWKAYAAGVEHREISISMDVKHNHFNTNKRFLKS